MTKPTIGVLSLQGDVSEHAHHLQLAGARPLAVADLDSLKRCDGIILPGGESTTIDKLLRLFDLYEPLREAIGAGMPVYGSCAGMILLADDILDGDGIQSTLGGIDMQVRRNAFGRQIDSAEALIPAGAFGGKTPLPAVFIRAPWVEKVGPDVEILAQWTPPQATGGKIVAVRSRSLLATSFHPEISPDNRVHSYFVKMVIRRNKGENHVRTL